MYRRYRPPCHGKVLDSSLGGKNGQEKFFLNAGGDYEQNILVHGVGLIERIRTVDLSISYVTRWLQRLV